MVDRVRNVEIREELKQEGVLVKVKRSQVRWRQALAEMGAERLVRRVYEAEMEGQEEGEEGGQGENGTIILSNDMFINRLYI